MTTKKTSTANTTTTTTTTGQPKVICSTPGVKSHILVRRRSKQKGNCWQCEKKITIDHDIVRRGKKHTRYYHRECAEKLNII
jgi:hypothetical protein